MITLRRTAPQCSAKNIGLDVDDVGVLIFVIRINRAQIGWLDDFWTLMIESCPVMDDTASGAASEVQS
ncbi:hypothetical protein BC2230_170006 [Burkholderia cepacia]